MHYICCMYVYSVLHKIVFSDPFLGYLLTGIENSAISLIGNHSNIIAWYCLYICFYDLNPVTVYDSIIVICRCKDM